MSWDSDDNGLVLEEKLRLIELELLINLGRATRKEQTEYDKLKTISQNN